MNKGSFIVIGAGSRGAIYTNYVKEHPEEGKAVAICEPRDYARNALGDAYDIPESLRFHDWREVLDKPQLADAALVCTQDVDHKEPATALADT